MQRTLTAKSADKCKLFTKIDSFYIYKFMMNSKRFTLLLLFFCISVVAQQKITVEGIYSGAFRTKGMDELQSMKNTNQYTVLNFDQSKRSFSIDLYNYATLAKADQIISSADFAPVKMRSNFCWQQIQYQFIGIRLLQITFCTIATQKV